MKLDSPFVLALGGTLAVHLVLFAVADLLVSLDPVPPPEEAPHVEMVEIDMPPPPPPPPPVAAPLPDPEPVSPPPVVARVETHPPSRVVDRPTTPPPDPVTPPPDDHPASPGGGEQVVQMEDLAPTKDGVAVGRGKPHDRIGRGAGTGSGTGAGAGTGSGSGGDAPPTSIASIKTPARPRGDYGYFDAGRDYPPEARQLGIEGVIKVKLAVDARGKVTAATALTKLGHGLDELAVARARTIEFTPAVDTDDHPTPSLVIWTFHMTLPK